MDCRLLRAWKHGERSVSPGSRHVHKQDAGGLSHLSHVSLGGEDDRLQPVVRHRQSLLGHHFLQPGQDLSVRQLGVAEDGAAGLDGLNDLVGGVAGQGEARGPGVDLHDPPQGLLSPVRHAGEQNRTAENV